MCITDTGAVCVTLNFRVTYRFKVAVSLVALVLVSGAISPMFAVAVPGADMMMYCPPHCQMMVHQQPSDAAKPTQPLAPCCQTSSSKPVQVVVTSPPNTTVGTVQTQAIRAIAVRETPEKNSDYSGNAQAISSQALLCTFLI